MARYIYIVYEEENGVTVFAHRADAQEYFDAGAESGTNPDGIFAEPLPPLEAAAPAMLEALREASEQSHAPGCARHVVSAAECTCFLSAVHAAIEKSKSK